MRWAATAFLVLGGFLCCLNFYLSFLRYPIHTLSGSKKEYEWASGIPILGSAFVALSLIVLWSYPLILFVSWVLMLIDTGGLHWFIGMMVYQGIRKEQ